MSETQQWLERGRSSLIQNYGRAPVVMVRGEGCHVYDADAKAYLDLFAGFGGCVLGHCHPDLVHAATEQAGKLWHVGNALYTTPQIEFAEHLRRHAFDGRAFFCHSGLEANEAAVKLARLKGMRAGGRRWKTISLNRSFHGRSLAMIAANGGPATREGFGPTVPGFTQVDPYDLAALERAVDDETCCVLMEPIQGEGGINVFSPGHVRQVRDLCDRHGLTLIFDEVWCGGGRTGKMFGYQHDGVVPDVMTLGGNPLCMAVAKTLFEVIERDGLLAHATRLGERAFARLRPHVGPKIKEVRGHGLFLGIDLHDEPADFAAKALDRGLVLNLTAKTVIRLAPPINIPAALWDDGLDRTLDLIASL